MLIVFWFKRAASNSRLQSWTALETVGCGIKGLDTFALFFGAKVGLRTFNAEQTFCQTVVTIVSRAITSINTWSTTRSITFPIIITPDRWIQLTTVIRIDF